MKRVGLSLEQRRDRAEELAALATMARSMKA